MSLIRLQFSTGNDIVSRAIALFSRGWCSHVDAVLPDGALLGARLSGGVRVRPPGYVKFSRTLIIAVTVPDAQANTFYRWLQAQVGKPYDWRAIVAFVFSRNWREPDSWFCSELVARAFEVSGFFPAPLMVRSSKITPRDLLLLISPWRKVPNQ